MSSWCVQVLIILIAGCWERGSGDLQPPSVSVSGGLENSTLLLALQEGPKGEVHLQEWAMCIESMSQMELPPVWVVCRENTQTPSLLESLAPQFLPFVVEENASWDTVLKNFALQVRRSG